MNEMEDSRQADTFRRDDLRRRDTQRFEDKAAQNKNDIQADIAANAIDNRNDKRRIMENIDNQSLATKTILDRLETLLQNVPTEADLTGRLTQLEDIFERNQKLMAEGVADANYGVAEVKHWMLEIEQELEGVKKQDLVQVNNLLQTVANDTFVEPPPPDVKSLKMEETKKWRIANNKVNKHLNAAERAEVDVAVRARMMETPSDVPPLIRRAQSSIPILSSALSQQQILRQERDAIEARPKFNIVPRAQLGTRIVYSRPNSQAEDEDSQSSVLSDMMGIGLNRKRIDPRHVRFVGRGIALEAEPKKYYEFGKYMISIPHLGNNILKVKYLQNGNEVPSFNSQKISDDLTDFIEDLVDTGKINERHLNKLEAPEKRLFSKLINQSGLYGKFKIRVLKNPNDKAEEDRFELVKGEFIAGNDNPAIVKELKHLIIKFMTEGRIPKNQGHELLFQLSV
jgi:hypothetical protein